MRKYFAAILLLLLSASLALSVQKPDEWIKYTYVLQLISPSSLDSEALAAKATKYFDSFQVVKN